MRSGWRMVERFLRQKIRDARHSSAVEFGPGDAPIGHRLGFRQVTFVDTSTEVLKQTKKLLDENKWDKKNDLRYEVADIRKFSRQRERNGVAIANEVFTHLRPHERMPTLERLAGSFDRIFLIDNEISHRNYNKRARRTGAPSDTGTMTPENQPALSHHEQFANKLRELGFHVNVALVDMREYESIGVGYSKRFVIWAERAPEGEKPRVHVRKRFLFTEDMRTGKHQWNEKK